MNPLHRLKQKIKEKNQETGRGILIIIGSKDFRHGTGRSVIARTLAKQLDAQHYSTGDKFREMAKQKNMTISDYAKYVESHAGIDKEFDQQSQKDVMVLIETGKNVVADSNLLAYFLTADVSIVIDAPDELRAERVYKKHREADARYENTEDALNHLKTRNGGDKERYEQLYGINTEELTESYDFYVENTGTLEQTMNRIIENVYQKLARDEEKNQKIGEEKC